MLAFIRPAAAARLGASRTARGRGADRGAKQSATLAGSSSSGDLRLAGAIAYWLFDAAVLWAMLHAFGAAPRLPVVVIAYFVGQAANTLPIPGSVSGGIAGVLIAFGLPAVIALPAVLAYRTVSRVAADADRGRAAPGPALDDRALGSRRLPPGRAATSRNEDRRIAGKRSSTYPATASHRS